MNKKIVAIIVLILLMGSVGGMFLAGLGLEIG